MQAVWMKNAIALCLIAESCNGNHFKGPVNTSVPEGTRATLQCQTSPSKTVWWKYFQKEAFYANTISHDFKSSHEAEVNASRGIYNLTVRNASSHAGLYTCVDDDGEGESGSAWLTVTAIETTPNPSAKNNTLPSAENNIPIVAIAVALSACLVVSVIVILVIFRKKRLECCQPRASEDSSKSTAAKNDEEEAFMNTRSPSEEQENSDNGPVAKPRMRNELEKPLASTPVGKEVSGNDNVDTTGRESTNESTNMTDNTQTYPLKSHIHKDERPKVPSTVPPKPTKAEESIVVPEEDNQKNEAIASPEKQAGHVAKLKMWYELETSLPSTTPVGKEVSGNDNVDTTGRESRNESTNMTDNTQTYPLKSDTHKDERSTVPPKPTKAEESIVVPQEDNQKNEAIASPEKQAGHVAKLKMRYEPETSLASTTPVGKEVSGNDNVDSTGRESRNESTNITDNTQTDPSKSDTHKDERPKVPPTVPPNSTKAEESIAVPEENSQKNEAIASPGKQDSGAKEKPPLKPKPSMTNADTANVRTKSTTNSGGINRASDAEQGKAYSSPKQNEEGIPHQENIVNTEEQDLSKQSVTEGDDKKEISFKNEQHIG